MGKENILELSYIYPSKERALKEFRFDPEVECEMGTVFLAKIVQRQERKRIEKTFVTTINVESGQIESEVEYSVTDTNEEDPC